MSLHFKTGKETPMRAFRTLLPGIFAALFLLTFSAAALGQTPSSALLILEKSDNSLIIVDPATLKITGRVPAGPDPHEVIASTDGKFAFVSNYGGLQSKYHTISVIDLVAQKALPPIDLGALSGTHGLDFAAGKLYFTAEPDKAIGRVDPATMKVDWILGIGQNRTHMVLVSKDASRIFTSNVNSDSIGIVEQTAVAPMGPPPGGAGGNPPPAMNGNPPPPGNQKDWNVTIIPVGKGPEGFDVSPDGKELWAANSHDGTISVIDLASKKVVATISAPSRMANRVKFTLDGKLVLVSDLGSGDFIVLDAATRKETKRLKLGRGVAGILPAPDGTHVYVAASPDDKVLVLDLKTLAVTGEIATGKQPDGMAWAQRN
jgi:YVTN family beta-propeller protein